MEKMEKNLNDIFAKCYTDGGYFGKLRYEGDRFLSRPVLPAVPHTEMEFAGKKCIMWSINNYLGLANHPTITRVAQEAISTYGYSAPMGSRMMSGTTEHHLALERALASWHGKEAAFVFNYGYLGVLGIVSSLAGPRDTIVMDKLSHACIVDAAFLSRANIRVFKHNDVRDLEHILQTLEKNRKGGILVLTEGVYGMTGDLMRLREIITIKNRYGARLFVDDAHGCGVLGEGGRGIGEFFDLSEEIDIYFGTFAKAFAAIGGFAVAKKEIIEWIEYNSRTQVFAKSLPMIYVKVLQETLQYVNGTTGTMQRELMWENSKRLSEGLKERGFYVGNGKSPIVSVYIPVGKEAPLESIAPQSIRYLRENGVFVTGIIYPVIPTGLVMFRMIPTALHTEEQIIYTLEQFEKMRDALSLTTKMSEEELKRLNRIY